MSEASDYAERVFRALAGANSLRIENARTSRDLGFAYYTSAETATNILQNKCVWMRNARLMNDYSEIEYGTACVRDAFGEGSLFKNAFSNIPSKSSDEPLWSVIAAVFDEWLSDLGGNTYITCVSEHNFVEDQLGRLSMWRAYGGQNGVALIIKPDALLMDQDKLHAYSTPVSYMSQQQSRFYFAPSVQQLLHLIPKTEEEERLFVENVSWALQMLAMSLKHPGFQEEREWRIFFRPGMFESDYIRSQDVVVEGVPQKIYKIPLDPDINLSADNVFARLIIGPSQHAHQTASHLKEVMENAGIQQAEQKITISGIPLRR